MTTPFGGQRTPFIIDLATNKAGNNALVSEITEAFTSTITTAISEATMIDFSKITAGVFYFEAVWGHAILSTAAGAGAKFELRDYTNATTLAISSTTTSANTQIVGAVAGQEPDADFISFTKPASTAVLGARFVNPDTSARNYYLYKARIWVI